MIRNGEDRKCKYCEKEFHVPLNRIKEGRGIYCSKMCYHNDKKGAPIICRGCGKEFRIAQSVSEGRLYCTRECRAKHLGFNKKRYCVDCGVEVSCNSTGRCLICAMKHSHYGEKNVNWSGGLRDVKCSQCGKAIKRQKCGVKKDNFCSITCHNEWQREAGKIRTLNNPNRRKRKVRFEARKIGVYEQWRKMVFKRDGYKCVNGCEDKYIEAHHIKTFDSILQEYGIDTLDEALGCKELWDTDNGVTLCKECHKSHHRKIKVA